LPKLPRAGDDLKWVYNATGWSVDEGDETWKIMLSSQGPRDLCGNHAALREICAQNSKKKKKQRFMTLGSGVLEVSGHVPGWRG